MSDQTSEFEARLAHAQTKVEKIDALNELAWDLRYFDPKRTQLYGEQAHELATTESYPVGLAESLRTLGYLNTENGHFGLGLSQSFEALEILKQTEKHPLEIDVLRNVSWAYRGFGDYVVALDYQMKALALAQEIGDKEREFRVLSIIASIYAETNQVEEAIRIEKNCLEFYRQLGKKDDESLALNNLAMSYLEAGDDASALEMALAALNLAQENNFSLVTLSALNTIGEIYLAMQDQSQAMAYLRQAISLAKEQNAAYDQYCNLLDMGKAYYQQNDVVNTLAYLHQSLAVADQTQNRMGQIQCHELLAEVNEKQGNLTEALSHWKQFHFIKESIFNENSAKRIANLQVLHQVETAKRDAEIYHLRNEELLREINERKKAELALQELAMTDPLTGLFNRRHFFRAAEFLLAEAIRYKHSLSIMVLDIDHFKHVNDTYGHATGDTAIKFLAATIKTIIRTADVAARFGGDEFVVLMPETNIEQALKSAHRLRLYLAERTIPASQHRFHFTLSLGVASISADVNTIDMLLEHADQALYTAKQKGRNQVEMWMDDK